MLRPGYIYLGFFGFWIADFGRVFWLHDIWDNICQPINFLPG
ncbi:hypothetical protein O77CONTIG1_00254 [Leptolyngbya sp. O-77]|nr:hypothetical protein O77CONTIG1_00254 [Leptolyngbya sp. O-77]